MISDDRDCRGFGGTTESPISPILWKVRNLARRVKGNVIPSLCLRSRDVFRIPGMIILFGDLPTHNTFFFTFVSMAKPLVGVWGGNGG